MHDIHDLRRIDLNLLVVLDALLSERHVSRAAQRLAMTQPAVSHALARLRALLGDPLLVRHGAAMQLTPRAQALLAPLADALGRVRELVLPSPFLPANCRRCFRIGMSDYGSAVVLPPLLNALRQQAPLVTLEVSHHSRLEMIRQVEAGLLDLAVLVAPMLPPAVRGEPLFSEHYVTVTDRRNLAAGQQAMTLDQYLAAPHLHISIQGMHHSHVDEALALQGLTRRVVVVAPHYMVAAQALVGTDLVLTLASRALACQHLPATLLCFAPPLAVNSFELIQIWRQDSERDAEIVWLRSLLRNARSDIC